MSKYWWIIGVVILLLLQTVLVSAPGTVAPGTASASGGNTEGLCFPLDKNSFKKISWNFGSGRDDKDKDGNGERCHAGIDLYTKGEGKVYAIADGVVTNVFSFTDCTGGDAVAVMIYHSQFGFTINYGEINLGSAQVSEGVSVKRGQYLGKATACKMLHFEVYTGNVNTNKKWLPPSGKTVSMNSPGICITDYSSTMPNGLQNPTSLVNSLNNKFCTGEGAPVLPIITESDEEEPSGGVVGAGAITTTSGSSFNLPQRWKEIDDVWMKISPYVGGEGKNKVWDSSLGEWQWRNYNDVYPSVLPQTGQSKVIGECGSVKSTGLSDIRGIPSISEKTINTVLSNANSPAAGSGAYFIKYGSEYNIDPAFALAFFNVESSYGKNGVAKTTKGIGNIVYTSPALPDWKYTSNRDWSAYYSFDSSIKGWFNYIVNSSHYFKANKYTLETIIPIYAPAFENDATGYINSVKKYVQEYRALDQQLCGSTSGGASGLGISAPLGVSAASAQPAAASAGAAVPPDTTFTAPSGSGSFRFVVVSDYHEGSQLSVAKKTLLMESIKSQNPAFVIFNGDTINANKGSSSSNEHESDWEKFFATVSPLTSSGIPIFHVLGNHDYEGHSNAKQYHNTVWKKFYASQTAFYSKFSNFNYQTFPYYYFDYNGKRIILLNVPGVSIDTTQLNWLRELIVSDSLVFAHVPVFEVQGAKCEGDDTKNTDCDKYRELYIRERQNELLEILSDADSMIFGGHQHYYYKANYNGNGDYNVPVVFVGTAGGDKRGIIHTYNNPTVQPHSYVVVDVNGDSVDVNAYIFDVSTSGFRLLTSADETTYFPQEPELSTLTTAQNFAPFSIS